MTLAGDFMHQISQEERCTVEIDKKRKFVYKTMLAKTISSMYWRFESLRATPFTHDIPGKSQFQDVQK